MAKPYALPVHIAYNTTLELTMPTPNDPEASITACVDHFYDLALADADLGPMFREAIPNLPEHLQVIRNFWSQALLGTKRYAGSPYTQHLHLPIELKHFDRWLMLFETAARADLPEDLAEKAMKRARNMTDSMRMGMFPFFDAQGRPSRSPG
jgi:hemoglobin